MQVTLLHASPPEHMMEAARTSHQSLPKKDSKKNQLGANDEKLLQKLVELEHHSVLEHVTYTFRIKGISRAVLQELARHRLISMTVKSTRYTLRKSLNDLKNGKVKVGDICVIPDGIPEDKKSEFESKLHDILMYAAESNLPNDVIKYVIPEALTTDLILTVNARELAHIVKLRTSPAALEEFRKLASTMAAEASKAHPQLWNIILANLDRF